MSVGNALTGLGQLQTAAFRRKKMQQLEEEAKKDREQQMKMLETQQDFKSTEASKERTWRSSEAEKARGPSWARINMAKHKMEREEPAAMEAAGAIDEFIEGKTLEGQLIKYGLKGGTLTPGEAAKGIPSGQQLYMGLMKKAFVAKDPKLKEALNNASEVMRIAYEDAEYREGLAKAAIKAAGGGGKNSATLSIQPDAVMSTVEEEIQKYFPDYDFEGRDKLAEEVVRQSKGNPGFSWPNTRKAIEDSVTAAIMKSDNRFRDKPVAAQAVASDLMEKIFISGRDGLMKPKMRGKTGEVEDGEYYGYQPIEVQVRRGDVFNTATPLFNSEKPKGEFSITGGKLKYRNTDIADYIITGKTKEEK